MERINIETIYPDLNIQKMIPRRRVPTVKRVYSSSINEIGSVHNVMFPEVKYEEFTPHAYRIGELDIAREKHEDIEDQINKFADKFTKRAIYAYYKFRMFLEKPYGGLEFDKIVRNYPIKIDFLISQSRVLSQEQFKKFMLNERYYEIVKIYDDTEDIAENIAIPKTFSTIYIIKETLVPFGIGVTAFAIVVIGIILIANNKGEKYYYIHNNN